MRSLALSIIALSGFAHALCAQGLLLVKTHAFDQESSADPVEYRTAEKFGTVYNIVTPSRKTERILGGLIVRDIVYSDVICPDSLVSQPDADRVKASIAKLKDAISKWPASGKYLQRHLDSNQLASDQLKKGYVLTGGKWITVQAYRASVAEAQKQADERQRQEDAAREKEMQAMQEAALAKAAQIEKDLDSLKAEAAKVASAVRELTTIEKRAFTLQRKLPKADFEKLYEAGPYVFQGITRGGEGCVLVSCSISTLEDRFIDFFVRRLGDIDVKIVNGSRERVPVFVEAKVEESAAVAKLEKLRAQIEAANRELEVIRAKLR